MRRFLPLLASLLGVLLLVWSPSAVAQNSKISAQQDRKARLEREIKLLEEQLSANARSSSNAASRLNLLRSKVSARRELLAESEKELSVLNDSLERVRSGIDSISARLDTLTYYYDRLVLNAYRNRNARIWYMYILASQDLGQAGRRYGYLRALSSQMNSQGRQIKETRAQLEERQKRLEELKGATQKLRSERAADLSRLQGEENESQQLVARLQKDRKTYQNQLSAKRRQVESLNREIERLIAAAMKESSGSGGKQKNSGTAAKKAKPVDYTLSKNFEGNRGKLPWPAEGRVVERFGRHTHPVYTTLVMPFNNGISVVLAKDSAVKVVFDGVVRQVIVMPGYNQCVLVQHGEYFTFYCKLDKVAVKAGDKVSTGQVIGHVATIAGETQLHFQLWKEKTPQDPEGWLRPQQ